jgi:RNA polymerase sigma-70 factor (ECF subfamily)
MRWPLNDTWHHVPVRANGQLAVACYIYEPGQARFMPGVIDVLTIAGDRIAGVTAFLAPEMAGRPATSTELSGAGLFAHFGLPPEPPS